MTGIQALERTMPDIPLKPGRSTRVEQDLDTHLRQLLSRGSKAPKIHLVMDCLNTHQSEALVRLVAELEPQPMDWQKGTTGILQAMATRAAFLSNPAHRLVVHFTPKHCSWLSQIEIWFSILVRKLLRHSSKAWRKSRYRSALIPRPLLPKLGY